MSIPRPSVALVVAFVALFAALGGTGYAALKITGKNVVDKSLSDKEIKPNTLDGGEIQESTLGTVPQAAHAAAADSAQTAVKAADADAVGGIPAAQLMTVKTRAYETNIPQVENFPTGSPLHALNDLPPGTYVVSAQLSYHNPGVSGQESCTLEVPGSDETTTFTIEAGDTEALSMQEITISDSQFSPYVQCTSDGTDDLEGTGTILAIRVD